MKTTRVLRFAPSVTTHSSLFFLPRSGSLHALALAILLTLTAGAAIEAQAITMTSAVSRKDHGSAGTFDLPLNLGQANSATVEPRSGGPTTILFTFSDNITTVDGTLGSTNFSIANATFSDASITGNTLTLNLVSVLDSSLVLVSLNGIIDLASNALSGTDSLAIRALCGDVNQNGSATIGDMQAVKYRVGQAVSTANFLCDVNLNGSITIGDMQAVKYNLFHEIKSLPVVMTLALDRSGSMAGNGGSTFLPPAVKSFISFFDDNTDRVAQVSFASATKVDVAMQQPFKSAITNAVNSLTFNGSTYADGAIQLAQTQNQSTSIPAGQNVVKAIVFFTDGAPNTIHDTWPTNKTYNVGGTDSGNSYAIFNPSTGLQLPNSSTMYSGPAPAYCRTMITFVSVDGSTQTVSAANFRAEAHLRTVAAADSVRSKTNFVYCVGFGYAVTSPQQTAMLQIMANDPALLVNTNLPAPFITTQHPDLPSYFNPDQPAGEVVLAATAAELKQVLQKIVARILTQ